ncbi:hypothetical protein DBB29_08625 [Pandoraea cepalis]|uniref:Uncharacterized protein n=1 Tax=Pandoraea cepalis TaxID=2508294 RepID=A0AAW7MLH7_9BURK|nr:hypothetical protein [Pandoraea cepalis]MDN4573637.1 hypothetical protein [Pandoraea cepalis]MDN4578179.1 hypothetical protein [Pandoraea cepalis]
MRIAKTLTIIAVLFACSAAHAEPLSIDQAMAARRALDAVQAAGVHVNASPEVRNWLLDLVSTARTSLETAQRASVRQRLMDVAIRARVAGMFLNAPALVPAAATLDTLVQAL